MKIRYSYKYSDSDALSLRVCNSGHQECDPSYQWGPGVKTSYIIHYVINGKGMYNVGKRSYSLKKGDAFIIFPDEEISYCADENEPWEYCWVGFSGFNAAKMLTYTDFTRSSPVIHHDLGDELRDIIISINDSHGDSPAKRMFMSGKLLLLLSLFAKSSQLRSKVKPTAEEYVSLAEAYIQDNYTQPITVEDIAKHINISRSQLFRVFKEKYGQGPKEYLTAIRIGNACEMLENTSFSVISIANSVGFNDHMYFSTVFKKLNGVSPSDYRNK